MKIYVTDYEGKEHALDAIEGWSVMEIIRDYGLPLKAECGGACCCATCHIYVDSKWQDKVIPKEDDEEEMLDDSAIGLEENSRLSCQILMREDLDGLKVTLAPSGDE